MTRSLTQIALENADRLARVAGRVGFKQLGLSIRSRAFLGGGEPEAHALRFLVPRDALAVDVGAADGVYSWFLRALGARVLAFEPNPITHRELCEALPGVDVRNVALSNHAGSSVLRVPVVHRRVLTGWGTISGRNSFPELEPDAVEEFEVATTTLDACALRDVGFIKIDVEGMELEVLQGAESTIARDLPAILIEVGDEARGGMPAEVWRYLQSRGYSVVQMDRDGVFRVLASSPCVTGSVNLIALPPRHQI